MKMPRHTTGEADAKRLALQFGENARDTREALDERLVARRLTIERYTATGTTATRIRVGAAARPWAVLLARVAEVYNEAKPVTVSPTLNFAWDSTTKAVDVYEPSGLTADTTYRLSFLVVEE